MRLPRFHLSTLLLVCVCAGAWWGVYLNRHCWRLEKTIEERKEFYVFGSKQSHGEFSWIYERDRSITNDGSVFALYDGTMELGKSSKKGKCVRICVVVGDIWDGKTKEIDTIAVNGLIQWILYSPDSQH